MQNISPVTISSLIERASRIIHSVGYSEGLYPAHWVALRYFSEAPPSSRTSAGLARFQGMSLGPVYPAPRRHVERGGSRG